MFRVPAENGDGAPADAPGPGGAEDAATAPSVAACLRYGR
jgi:hypothetical protein